ncbi:DUF3467 domain-containing protein [Candidatus Woesearchaeota archaeon]|nr:DUF3467 domain-containing protein [Candidatus Woesearchaeota archaeon]
MAEEIPIDVNVGQEFFAEQVSVSHSPIRFVVDFVKNTPRIEASTHSTRLFTSHSVVLLDPYLAKEFLSVLTDNIGKYEQKFGKIEKPAALLKFEKEAHKHGKKPERQDYFG